MKKSLLIIPFLFLFIIEWVSAQINLDFTLGIEDKIYYPNEEIKVNVSIINRDMSFSANNVILNINIADRFYKFNLGDVEPDETFNKIITLPEFPPGTYNIIGVINYTALIGEQFSLETYNSFTVRFPIIERYPRNVNIVSFELPDKIFPNYDYETTVVVKNEGEIGGEMIIEVATLEEFFSESIYLGPDQSKTVKMTVNFNNPGVSLIEARVYALVNNERYLLVYSGKKAYLREERKAKLSIGNIAMVDEPDNEINQNDEVGIKIFLKNDGYTATDVIGSLSSQYPDINVKDNVVNYGVIAEGLNYAKSDDFFMIKTTDAKVQNYSLILDVSYVDSEQRTISFEIPIEVSKGGDSCKSDTECEDNSKCVDGRCELLSCDCGFVKNHKCIDYECCLDGDCKSDYICDQNNHKCTLTTNITRDVLIITNGAKISKPSNYYTTLEDYRKSLNKNGLSSFYQELDSKSLNEKFGITVKDLSDWREVKKAIDKLNDKIKPKYLLILGGVDATPMPEIKNDCFDDMNLDAVPTDDVYADTNLDLKPDIILGRIPTAGKHLTNYLKTLIRLHENGISVSKKLIVGNYCEGESCFEKEETDDTSEKIFKVDCSETDNCIWSPPYCIAHGSYPIFPIPCSKNSEYFNRLENSNYIYFVSHGDGMAFMGAGIKIAGAPLTGTLILSGLAVQNSVDFKEPPVIMSVACLGGSIDVMSVCLLPKACLYPEVTKNVGTAVSFINKGATYFGNTRYGLSWYTLQHLSYIYNQFFKVKKTGDAYLGMKQHQLSDFSSECGLATIYQIQHYGDPTLRIKEEG